LTERPLIEAALIDLDGTLLDTVPDIAQAVNGMLAELGRPTLALERIGSFVGKGAERLVHRALTDDAHGQAQAELFASGLTSFKRHYHASNGLHARDYPNLREGLNAMHAAGLKLACVTNKPREFALPLLARTQLARYFSAVVAGGDTEQTKPHPAPYLRAAELLELPANACIGIGDSNNDAQACRAAGMRCLLLPYGYNEGAAIADAPCDALVEDLLAAARWIAALRNIQDSSV
jgi:phosphoglycolate phosphatase